MELSCQHLVLGSRESLFPPLVNSSVCVTEKDGWQTGMCQAEVDTGRKSIFNHYHRAAANLELRNTAETQHEIWILSESSSCCDKTESSE